jgi:hypothetical protein
MKKKRFTEAQIIAIKEAETAGNAREVVPAAQHAAYPATLTYHGCSRAASAGAGYPDRLLMPK